MSVQQSRGGSRDRFFISYSACRVVAMATVLCCAASTAHAWEYVKLRLSTSLRADDNIFRVPDGVNVNTPDGSAKRGDLIRTLAAGASLEIPISRQRLMLSYDINQTRYSNFTNLDFNGQDARLTWLWELGRLATGVAGAGRSKTRADFSTQQGRAPNILTSTRQFISGSYPFHANWLINWGAFHTEARNSDALNRFSDNDSNSVNGEVRYVSGSGTYVGLQATRSAADYFNPIVVGSTVFDNSYKQSSVGLVAGYTVGGSSSLQASLSRSRRDPVEVGRSTTNATTGGLTFNWQPTGLTALTATFARDFSPPENITVSGTVANTLGLAATWKPTGKLSVRANVGYQERDFLFVAGSPLSRRRDTTSSQGISLSYAALDKLSVVISASREHRDSDLPEAIYSTRGGSVALELAF